MNTELQSQTDLLLKALTQLHTDIVNLNLALGVIAVLLVAIFLVVAFKKR